ncbi:MAG TPA: SCO1664 family protein [Acidimicrobiales bacterium]|nr:SCO1664 family protein [Acidimicrobiales bacterium]
MSKHYVGQSADLALLERGRVEVKGRLPWSSNATFLVVVRDKGREASAIYKPGRGERPLWDFERGLWRREVAAFELARHLGWDIVPPTVGRHDGPFGAGSLQLWVEANFEEHYFTLFESPEHAAALKTVAAFDLVINNADRKSGHCLLDDQGHIWAIDNALSFHAEPKLRTVIWDFVGERIDAALLDDLAGLSAGEVPEALRSLLEPEEIEALVKRAASVRRRGTYPTPKSDYPYPWPLV